MGETTGPPGGVDVEAFIERWVERHEGEMVEDLRALIAIESVESPARPGQPFGEGVARALEFVEAAARRWGLRTLNADGYAIHGEMGAGRDLVGVLCHVDVVPAGDGWTVPPFGGIVRSGRIYGRGAIDDKGPTVAALYGAAALLASGAPLSRRIRLIVGGDEESGFECVRYYFARHERPSLAFSPDALFPVVFAEKGILTLQLSRAVKSSALRRLTGGVRPNVVPDRAEADLAFASREEAVACVERLRRAAAARRARLEVDEPCRDGENVVVRVRSRGAATHGSTPEKGINAASELLAALAEADGAAGLLDPEGVAGYLARAGLEVYGRGLGIARQDDVSGVLTANLGVIRWEEGNVEATFDVRYPVSLSSADELVQDVRQHAGALGFEVRVTEDQPPHHVSPDSFLVRTLLDVYRKETGDPLGPLAIGGGTYARVLPGAVAFGPVFPMQGIVPHEPDECIEVAHLRRLAVIYGKALWALAR